MPTRKAQALLAYLGVPPGRTHPRDKLATLLWGDLQTPQARASLRQALAALKKALAGTAALRLEGNTVALDPAAVRVDVQAFEARLAEGSAAALGQAAELYEGDLLAGLALQEAPFEEWLLAERERLREAAMEALARLLAHHRAAGAPEAAVQAALKLLALDPFQEPVHRTLMRLYAQLGRRAAALRQYQLCATVLERELHAEPEPDTKALYREILRERAQARSEPGPGAPAEAPRASATAGEAPLIGREAEMAELMAHLERAWAGRGLLVGLDGEAGIGKSRLAAEVAALAAARGGAVLAGRCYETEQMLPFAPWVEALRGAGVTRDAALMEAIGPVWRTELARILPEVADGGGGAPSGVDPARTFEAVGQLLDRLAARQPVLLVIEDLQWADETSVRLGAFLARRVATLPALILATGREEETANIPLLRHTREELDRSGQVASVRVGPLSVDATAALLRQLRPPGPAADDPDLARQVWRVSEGNPLVVVEMLRGVRRQPPAQAAAALTLPAPVRALIARRLARLDEPARRLVALAATISRQFDFALLQRAAGLSEHDAAEGVEELVRHQILQQAGDGLEFVHQRVREVAYGQLLGPRRMLLHRAVGEALETLYAPDLDPHALALGTHFREGQVWDRAAVFLGRAGTFASARLAHRDAVACFAQALAALAHLPDDPDVTRQASDLWFNRARSAYSVSAMDEALEGFHRAQALAEAVGDERRIAGVSAGMTYLLASEGHYARAIEAGERAAGIARALPDSGLEVWTAIGLARACYAAGAYGRVVGLTRDALDRLRGTAVDGRLRPGSLLPSVGARTWLALGLVRTGDFPEAQTVAEEAVEIAERVDGLQELVWACYCLGHLELALGRFAEAAAVLGRAAALCEGGGFPLYAPRVLASLAAAHARPGQSERALLLLDQAVQAAESTRVLFGHSLMLCLLGVVQLLAGHDAEARHLAAQALDLTRQRGERGDEAWALHLAAEAAARADVDAALARYHEALAIAVDLGMRPLEGRCHLGLGALFGRTGQPAAARAALARAMELFQRMGMKFWLGRAEDAAGRLA